MAPRSASSRRQNAATATPVANKKHAPSPPDEVPAKMVDADPPAGQDPSVMAFLMGQVTTAQKERDAFKELADSKVEELKLASAVVEESKAKIKGIDGELKTALASLKEMSEEIERLKADLDAGKAALKAEKAAAEAALEEFVSDAEDEGDGASEAASEEAPKSERIPGKRGKKKEGSSARKVKKADICHDYPDREAVNFASTPFFAQNCVKSKGRYSSRFWKREKELDEEKRVKNPSIKERTKQGLYEQKTYSTNQAEHLLTLLTVKGAPWAETFVDGVLQLNLDQLLDFMFQPEFEKTSSGGGHSDGQTSRRWYITQLLHPNAFKDAEDAMSKKNRPTWEAMGKFVTAVNKAKELVREWEKLETKNATEDEAAQLWKDFDAVEKDKSKRQAKATKPPKEPKKTIQKKKKQPKKKAKKGSGSDSDSDSDSYSVDGDMD